MTETAAFIGIVSAFIAALAALYYKVGKMDQKIDLIYDNLKIVVAWNNNKKG